MNVAQMSFASSKQVFDNQCCIDISLEPACVPALALLSDRLAMLILWATSVQVHM